MKRLISIFLFGILVFTTIGCSTDRSVANIDVEEGVVLTVTTQEPTANPTPKITPEPTPKPTSTPTLEPIPENVIYTGEGDDVVDIDFPGGVFVFYIEGNANGRYFSVTGYDADGNYTDLFVNTTDPYTGITIDPSQKTRTLEINASSSWTVELRSIFTVRTISQGEIIDGVGDEILLVLSSGSKATITGNDEGRYFGVKSYGRSSDDLMVNTTEKYDGTVMIKGDPIVLAITATGAWTIEFH